MTLPYSRSEKGASREASIRGTLKELGATAIGFMVDEDRNLILCQFRMSGREVTVPIDLMGYATAYQKETGKTAKASMDQAHRAGWAILADWIKAQATIIRCGVMSSDEAFLAHVRLPSGDRVGEAITKMGGPLSLPKPKDTPDA